MTGWAATWMLVLLAVAGLSMVLAAVRVALGPGLPDRVVALDLATTAALALLTLYAVFQGQAVYLDVGIVVARVAFVGTIAFARYQEQEVRS